MNTSTADNAGQWLFLDLNAFFASCEQQDNPTLRGQPIIVVQTLTSSACAITASYEAKRLGITTGTLVREARQLCPAVIPVQANHRLYTEYHERMLAAVDTCVPVEKVMSIDEVACRLTGDQRQVPVARALALKLKRALREQVGECLTCSIGLATNVFLGKVGSDMQQPDGLVVITRDDLPDILLGLHNRMSVVLKPEAWPQWLGEEPADETRLKSLLASYPSDGMVCWPVSARVGNVRNNDPSLIEPIAAA
jgi:DNA polymerase IV